MSDQKGEQVWQAEYKPFGEEFTVNDLVDNNRRFVGKEKDDETGLDYFGARYLSVESGRFLAVDPVRAVDEFSGQINSAILTNPQRLNVYAYSLNNPYRYVDPDGEFGFLVCAAIVAGAQLGALAIAWLGSRGGLAAAEGIAKISGNQVNERIPGTVGGYAPSDAIDDIILVTAAAKVSGIGVTTLVAETATTVATNPGIYVLATENSGILQSGLASLGMGLLGSGGPDEPKYGMTPAQTIVSYGVDKVASRVGNIIHDRIKRKNDK